MTKTASQSLQEPWTVWDSKVWEYPLHLSVIRNQLTRNLHIITPMFASELEDGFARVWGNDSDWRSVHVWQDMIKLVASASNGIFLGRPLCLSPRIDFLEERAELTALRSRSGLPSRGSGLCFGCNHRSALDQYDSLCHQICCCLGGSVQLPEIVSTRSSETVSRRVRQIREVHTSLG